MVKFRRGLWLGIQNQIATMPYKQPADNDPDVWYRAAWRIDQAHLANEAFQSVSHSAPFAPTKTISAQPPPLFIARLPPIPPLLVPLKLPLPAPSMGVCHKLHSAISPSILHQFSRSQWLRKALEKTFRSVPVTSRGDQ